MHRLERQANTPVLCGVRYGERNGVGEAVIAPFAGNLFANANFFWLGGGAEQLYFRALPPRLICILFDVACHGHRANRNLAGIVDAQNLAFLVGERMPVVLIECTSAISV